jgi:hypothetical protein
MPTESSSSVIHVARSFLNPKYIKGRTSIGHKTPPHASFMLRATNVAINQVGVAVGRDLPDTISVAVCRP